MGWTWQALEGCWGDKLRMIPGIGGVDVYPVLNMAISRNYQIFTLIFVRSIQSDIVKIYLGFEYVYTYTYTQYFVKSLCPTRRMSQSYHRWAQLLVVQVMSWVRSGDPSFRPDSLQHRKGAQRNTQSQAAVPQMQPVTRG